MKSKITTKYGHLIIWLEEEKKMITDKQFDDALFLLTHNALENQNSRT